MAKIEVRKSQLDLIDKVLLERDQLHTEVERLRNTYECVWEINLEKEVYKTDCGLEFSKKDILSPGYICPNCDRRIIEKEKE